MCQRQFLICPIAAARPVSFLLQFRCRFLLIFTTPAFPSSSEFLLLLLAPLRQLCDFSRQRRFNSSIFPSYSLLHAFSKYAAFFAFAAAISAVFKERLQQYSYAGPEFLSPRAFTFAIIPRALHEALLLLRGPHDDMLLLQIFPPYAISISLLCAHDFKAAMHALLFDVDLRQK